MMGQTKNQRKMREYLKENCFAPPDFDVVGTMRYLRTQGVTYAVMGELTGLPECNMRQFCNPSPSRRITGKNMLAGYRLVNMLMQIKRAVDGRDA